MYFCTYVPMNCTNITLVVEIFVFTAILCIADGFFLNIAYFHVGLTVTHLKAALLFTERRLLSVYQ
jgi:hypothetical protein